MISSGSTTGRERKSPQFITSPNFRATTILPLEKVESLISVAHSMRSDTNWKCIVDNSQANRKRTKSNPWPDVSQSSVSHSVLSRKYEKGCRLAGHRPKWRLEKKFYPPERLRPHNQHLLGDPMQKGQDRALRRFNNSQSLGTGRLQPRLFHFNPASGR